MVKKRMTRALVLMLFIVMTAGCILSADMQTACAADSSFEAQLTSEGFPESYKVLLRKLHAEHPSWNFRAKQLDFTWKEALDAQCSNVSANLVSSSFKESYRAVQEGTYNFETGTYIPKDGSTWFAASRQAVAFYMDPRNWLTDTGIFMFEPFYYDASYQTEDIVKAILKPTALPSSASSYYMKAAQQTYNGSSYSISPVYLAVRTRIELGTGSFMVDGHEFTYGGKTYSGVYNTYNIGAVDSADGSAATKGLVFAAGGSSQSATSYLRPWNSLEKAVKGGAIYIADNFIANSQYALYYERFNVLNGISSIGTHQYATSIFHAATQASIMYTNYKDYGVLDKAFTFEIPVYKDMPSEAAPSPLAEGNNNSYLDNITLTADGKNLGFSPSFSRFTSTYTVSGTVAADKLDIKTEKNDSGCNVTVSGNSLKDGENKITIKCTSSSGFSTRYYYIKVTRDSSQQSSDNTRIIDGVENTTITLNPQEQGSGYVRLAWEKSKGFKVDRYQIFRSLSPDSFSSKPMYSTSYGTTTTYKNTKDLQEGTVYYYRVRGVRVIDGKTYYTRWSNVVQVTYNPEQMRLIQGVENTVLTMQPVSQGVGFVQTGWEKSKGFRMDCYEIYRSTDQENFGDVPFFTTKYGTTTSYKNTKDLVRNTVYYYKVRGVRVFDGVKYYSQWSDTVSIEYNPYDERIAKGVEATTVTASAAPDGKGIRISWEKSKGFRVDHYEVYRSVRKTSGYGDTPIYTTKYGTTLTVKNSANLKKGTRYYYKVRGVRYLEGMPYYTQWSNAADALWN
ncbi:MAG: cadherin-like beta sandwich domain-containing protein [Emergencia sp.]